MGSNKKKKKQIDDDVTHNTESSTNKAELFPKPESDNFKFSACDA